FSKLNQFLDKGEILVLIKSQGGRQEWETKKIDPSDRERIIKIFNIFFKAYYKELPHDILVLNNNSSYLATITKPYMGWPHINWLPDSTFEGLSFGSGPDGDRSKIITIYVLSLLSAGTFLAFYYILNRFLDSAEHIYYNENLLRESITI